MLHHLILISPYLLTNFEIQRYQNELRVNGVCSGNNIPKIIAETAHLANDAVFILDLNEYFLKET